MRRLRGADAGRLRGVEVQYHWDQFTNLDRMPQPWGTHLAELIEAHQAGRIGAESPAYVVVSDGLPVAWLTVHAAVVAPTMPMTTLQAKHQRQAAAVLAELDRQTLQTLADARDRREGRPVGAGWPSPGVPVGDLADVPATHRHARRVLEIVAAGGHHLALVGPATAATTMLAHRLPGLLPDLDDRTVAQAADLYHRAGLLHPHVQVRAGGSEREWRSVC